MAKPKIYFDHSATTPLDPAVKEAMRPYFLEIFGNASSIHSFGQAAAKAIDDSRQIIANFLGCLPKEIYFTAGATEADNLVIFGAARARSQAAKFKPHLIISQIEHPAILEPGRELEKPGLAEVTYVKVNPQGIVLIEEIKKAIKENTVLVSIMYVNNEIGAIQPIAEIGKMIFEENKKRPADRKILFHTDAVQATAYCPMKVKQLGVDLLSISGHKIYGPKGVGALYIKQGVRILPLQFGGHQEFGIRPGTLNVPGIVGLAKAVELLQKKDYSSELERIKKLRDKLIKGVLASIPNSVVNGDLINRVPANAHFSFKGAEGESLLLRLDLEGIAVSTGSACSSGSLEPSHVLLAMGLEPLVAHGSLRVTLGRFTTEKEIDYFLKVLPPIVQKLRQMAPKLE